MAAATAEVAEDAFRDLHAKIGELAVANEFLSRKLKSLDREVRCRMIEWNHPKLSVGAQCTLLSISRSSFYYAPQGETALNFDLMW